MRDADQGADTAVWLAWAALAVVAAVDGHADDAAAGHAGKMGQRDVVLDRIAQHQPQLLAVLGDQRHAGPDLGPEAFVMLRRAADQAGGEADEVHEHGAACMIQLTHLGRRTAWNKADWLPVLAPEGPQWR